MMVVLIFWIKHFLQNTHIEAIKDKGWTKDNM